MEFCTATSVEHVLELLGQHGSDARLLAGGTDVMMQRMRGDIAEPVLVHLERIDPLRHIAINGCVSLGALVTHRDVRGSDLPRGFESIVDACATVGGWQTQNVGTVVGNVCNASPAADLMPALLTLGTEVVLQSVRGERRVGLADFVTGRRTVDRAADEVVVALDVAVPSGASGSAYTKVGRRRAMEVAIAGLAVRVSLDRQGSLAEVAIASCSLGPTPCRHSNVEEIVLTGQADASSLHEAADVLRAAIEPLTDARATATYRWQVIGRILPRTVGAAIDRARLTQVEVGG
jgi:aerobic carbon-monoxide dehydrogenase medium subunit